MVGNSGGRGRIYFLSFALFMGFMAIILRLFYLQVVQASILNDRAIKQRQKTVILEGERGTIYDQKGRVLAINIDLPSIFSTPAQVSDPSKTARVLGSILKRDHRPLQDRLRSNRGFVWIERKVDPLVAEEIRKLELEGIGFLPESRRFYPKRSLMGHVLGFAGLDNKGLEGIELKYDRYLQGKKRWVVVERDAMGGSVFPKDLVYAQPSRGKDIILTIDEVIQFISERELAQGILESSAKGGYVIVMDPNSGRIYSLVVHPKFDPNQLGKNNPGEWRNRAITDLYEPGSTFKIFTAAAVLEEKLVSPEEVIDCENGVHRINGGDLHDHKPYGLLRFEEVIQKSSNIGIYKVVKRLGKEKLYQYIRAFGFGEKTGIDLNGESPGLVHPPDRWSGRSLASLSMGQEVGVTAIQVVRAASVVANGGWLPQPHFVSEIHDPKGKVLKKFTYPLTRRVISQRTSLQMREILKSVVRKGGTGELAAMEGYSVAGKTGTAQKIDPETGRYGKNKVISSFIGFVPADDPKIIVYVVLDEPQGVHWGGKVAAPIFKRIAQQSLAYLGVLPKRGNQVLLVSH